MPLISASTPTNRSPWVSLTAASVLLLGLAAGGIWSVSQVAMVPSAVPPALAAQAHDDDGASLSSDAHSRVRLSSSGPDWRDITAAQRQVLTPLRDRWNTMGALAKRRWLVLADRYPSMDESERNKLDSRMRTWASLSAQQRNQARLNFENIKRLSPQELQAKWDEYQALSEAERQRLAEEARKAKAAKKTKAAKRKLAQVPAKKPVAPVHIPAAPAPVEVTSHPVPTPLVVETAPIHSPQAAPSTNLLPLVESPAKMEPLPASSLPVLVPQISTTVDLPPLEALNEGAASSPAPATPAAIPTPETPPQPSHAH
ncbi:MAG: DUF3106 domain-containing protein [Comamonas sp.]